MDCYEGGQLFLVRLCQIWAQSRDGVSGLLCLLYKVFFDYFCVVCTCTGAIVSGVHKRVKGWAGGEWRRSMPGWLYASTRCVSLMPEVRGSNLNTVKHNNRVVSEWVSTWMCWVLKVQASDVNCALKCGLRPLTLVSGLRAPDPRLNRRQTSRGKSPTNSRPGRCNSPNSP